MRLLVAVLMTLLAAAPAAGRDVGGVPVPESVTVAGAPLALNGAGIRKKLFVDVYVGALYFAPPAAEAARVIDAATARVMRLAFLRDVEAGKLAGAWRDGFAANHGSDENAALRARLERFNGLMRDVRRGEVLRLELLANGETRIWFNDELRGAIEGADFQRALLRVWLGAKPADAGLKQALLGGGR